MPIVGLITENKIGDRENEAILSNIYGLTP